MKKVLGLIVTLGLILALAACTAASFTVTFDVDGGSAVDSITVTDGEMITEPTEPTKLGYVFGGWYADEALSDSFNFTSDAVDAEITLYAKWVQDAVTFSGADNEDVDFQAAFNVLDGVTATGSTGVDYTDYISYSTIGDVDDNDNLNTDLPGNTTIQYEVKIDTLILGQKFRTITVASLDKQEGDMLVNADFTYGPAGWDTFSADGSTIVLSSEEFDGNPALKVEVVAGANLWTPRFTQMNVPFVEDTTYEITFRAKSSVAKTINLQVGEILAAAPWFTDFKPGLSVTKDITTEWATYSFKFTMNQGDENFRGGILFELGTFANQTGVNATMWFDDITIEVSTPDADETAPVLSGLTENRTVLVGNEFDPTNGVSAFDVVDGDLTDSIEIVIKDALDQVVEAVDTSVENAVYTITYTISDEAGNEASFVVTLTVVGMQFYDTNLIVNGEFDNAMSDPAEWISWTQDWGSVPVVVHTLDNENGVYTVDITGGGDAAWAVQLYQDGVTLMEGHTYRVQVTAKAEAARKLNIAIGVQDGENFDEYARFDGVQLGTDYTTQEFVFTVTKATSENIKVNFELGTQDGFADGLITFDTIAVNEAMLDELLVNSSLSDTGWTSYSHDNSLTVSLVDGAFDVTVASVGSNLYDNQFNQTITLEAGKTYTLTFDAKTSVVRDINIKLFKSNVWVNHLEVLNLALTTEFATYTYDFTVPAEADATDLTLSFELGATSAAVASTLSFDNISLVEKDVAEAPELIVNGNAETVLGFELFTENDSTMVLSNDGAVVSVNTLGAQAYQPHVFQMINDGLAAGTYVLKLVVSADVARDLRANLVVPDWGYASLLPDSLYDYQTVENDQVVVSVSFTLANDVAAAVKLELDFGTLGGELVSSLGTFTINEVLLYPDFN